MSPGLSVNHWAEMIFLLWVTFSGFDAIKAQLELYAKHMHNGL